MRRLAFGFFGLAVLATASTARADDVTDLEGLLDQSVVTTATKTAQTTTTAPALSTTITAEDMRRYGIHSLDEAIDFLSLGAVTSNPLKAVDIGARGVLLPNDSGDHFALLVNGHQLNEPMFGSARFDRGLGIPFEMIDHIEVVLGPGSVLYGSNAMLGVINVITKQAKDWSGFHVVGETEIAKSYRVLAGAGFETTLLGKPAWLTFGAEYYTQDGPPLLYGFEYSGIDPASIQKYNFDRTRPADGYWGGLSKHGYYARVPSGLLRVVWGDFELGVSAKAYKRAHPYRARYTDDFADFDDPDSYELDRHLWGDLTFHRRLSPIVELTARLYGDTFDYQNVRNSSEASACLSAGDATVPTCTFKSPAVSRWGGLETRTSFDWLRNDRFVTMVGVDERIRFGGIKIDVSNYATGQPLRSSIGAFRQQDELLGAYVQQTWLPLSWLSLNGGARVDNENRYRGVVSPRVAAAAKTWSGGTVKGIYAEAFRSPSFVETDLENPIQLLSHDLQPERVRSIDVSVEQRVGVQRFLLGGFRSWFTDLVEQHVLTPDEQGDAVRRGEILVISSGVAQFRNVSSLDNYGVNGMFEGAAGPDKQLHYGVNLTGAITHHTEGGTTIESIPVAPAVFGNARVSYDLPGQWPTLAVATHYLSRRPADRAYDGSWPVKPYADAQLELRATISGAVPKLKGLTYRASINWAALADHGPYVVGPVQSAERYTTVPLLNPIDTVRATVGLEWNFGQ